MWVNALILAISLTQLYNNPLFYQDYMNFFWKYNLNDIALVQDVLQDPPNQFNKEQHVYTNLQDQLYLLLCKQTTQ